MSDTPVNIEEVGIQPLTPPAKKPNETYYETLARRVREETLRLGGAPSYREVMAEIGPAPEPKLTVRELHAAAKERMRATRARAVRLGYTPFPRGVTICEWRNGQWIPVTNPQETQENTDT